ncbi:hypothetical protein [Breoghania sp.]|uniref:hypothetical protein n=1 Tax=Breoghania sp. TaxID=2065378 RepID=UPI00260526A5|nr:hypothetical protein [Breoghania sp.]MDJ0932151.1 hypothetical protein [Breoghania sp.]
MGSKTSNGATATLASSRPKTLIQVTAVIATSAAPPASASQRVMKSMTWPTRRSSRGASPLAWLTIPIPPN